MQVGVFLPSATGGYIISTTSPSPEPTYELQLAITKLAEEVGFDFSMSMQKHHGFGGPSRFWDEALDSMTMMAGLAAATERIGIIGTVPMLAVHPATAARQAVTVNAIAEGRFMLNFVTGWARTEYEQYGLWPGEAHYSRRYDYASEYVQIMQQFWSTGRSNFKGEYFDMHDAVVLPQPPGGDIPLVCAGQSDRGLQFTAEYGRYSFITGTPEEVVTSKQRLDAAAAKTGRSVDALPIFMVVMAPTDEEAQERYQHILDGADMVAMNNLATDAGAGAKSGSTAEAFVERTIFTAQAALVGSYETIGRILRGLTDDGTVDGVMFTFVDYLEDVRNFGEHVLPQLRAGAAR